MPGPLSGHRILDLSNIVTGPFGTQLLGDQGADVIKVESKSGDIARLGAPMRGGVAALFLNVNRNKRSIALDLKQPEGVEIVKRLARTSDVFVQNFRPGAIERLGLSEPEVRRERSDIVYMSISGFGATGPYAHKRVYDGLVQAASGLMSQQGGKGPPEMIGMVIADKLTATISSQAITAALLERSISGKGQHVELSMLDAMVAWLWPDAMAGLTFLGEGATPPVPPGAYAGPFSSKDGHLMVMIVSDAEWLGFCRAAERPELAEDARFRSAPGRVEQLDELYAAMGEALKDRTTEDWLRRFDAEQVPCSAVNDLDQVVSDPQVVANELLEESQHPTAGALRQARPAARFSRTAADARAPAPNLGQHTEELLSELGYRRTEIEELRNKQVI